MKVSQHATEGSLLLVGCNFHQFPKLSRNYENEMHERERLFCKHANLRLASLRQAAGEGAQKEHFGTLSLHCSAVFACAGKHKCIRLVDAPLSNFPVASADVDEEESLGGKDSRQQTV